MIIRESEMKKKKCIFSNKNWCTLDTGLWFCSQDNFCTCLVCYIHLWNLICFCLLMCVLLLTKKKYNNKKIMYLLESSIVVFFKWNLFKMKFKTKQVINISVFVLPFYNESWLESQHDSRVRHNCSYTFCNTIISMAEGRIWSFNGNMESVLLYVDNFFER